MKLTFWMYVPLGCMACTAQDNDTPVNPQKVALQNLSGTYMDAQPYVYDEAFGQRTFTFDKGQWTLSFTLGLDPALEQAVFTFRTFGTFEVLDASQTVPGAYDALFLEEKKFLTLETPSPELAAAFGFTSCGLDVGVEHDISETGCALWAAVSECNEDHDLLKLSTEGTLQFGVRSPDNNMCTAQRRPTALTPGVTIISDKDQSGY